MVFFRSNRGRIVSPLKMNKAAAICLSIAYAGVLAQGQNKPQIQEERTVTLKLLQVYVLDKSGRPVMDLEQDDFVLTDNGKDQHITAFERHSPPSPELRHEAQPSATPAASLFFRKFFMIFDISQSKMRGLNASKKAALAFLEKWALPTDEIAVLTLSINRGISLIQYLTKDRELLNAAIAKIHDVPGLGMDEYNPTEDLALEGVDLGPGYEKLLIGMNPTKERFFMATFNLIETLREFAKSIITLPGFKNIIYYSSGVQEQFLYDDVDSSLRSSYEDLIKAVSNAGCPIYAINARDPVALQSPADARGDHFLNSLSLQSGGLYFPNIGKADAISRAISEATSHYYILGFSVDDKWDEQSHRIKVAVKRAKCTVRTQQEIIKPKPFGEWSEFEKEVMFLNYLQSEDLWTQRLSPIRLASWWLPGQRSGFLVAARLSMSEFTQSPQGRVEFGAVLLDQQKTVIKIYRGFIITGTISDAQFSLFTFFQLPPDSYLYRIVFRDPETGDGWKGEISAPLSMLPSEPERLSQPFLLLPRGEARSLLLPSEGFDVFRALSKEQQKGDKLIPDIFLATTPVFNEISLPAPKLLVLTRITNVGLENPDLELEVGLCPLGSDQEIHLEGNVVAVEQLSEFDFILIETKLPNVPPGEYELRLSAKGEDNTILLKTSVHLRVLIK